MTKLTENEAKLIRHIIKESSFNCDSLDLEKSWDEQTLEEPDVFITFIELNEYSRILETSTSGSRGILGSLVKKNLIDIQQDDVNAKNYWLYIDETQFNSIKEALQ